uniref:PCI domain-containing protein n=1 Tax=Neospora caninum (strain Liverpool) TaxID=572307 RepID=A0A0F7U9K5_NEOCL|nr:TPA: hypothetical protein BN1204_023850 [Neospora caninum Liverpool]
MARLLCVPDSDGPEEKENAFWAAATVPSAKSVAEAFADYPDVVCIPRLLHFVRVAVKQQRRHQSQELRRSASNPREGQPETEAGEDRQRIAAEEQGGTEPQQRARQLDELEALIFQGCCLLLEASQRQRNAAAHAQARRLWDEHRVLCAAESTGTLNDKRSLPHRDRAREERDEEIRKLYNAAFVNECGDGMPDMRERLVRAMQQAHTTHLGPVRRRTLMEVADFLMAQGDFLEVLQVLEGGRLDFDEYPNDIEYANLGATCALLSLESTAFSVLRPCLTRWTNLLDLTVGANVPGHHARCDPDAGPRSSSSASSASSSRASIDGPAGPSESGEHHSVSQRSGESRGEPGYGEGARSGHLVRGGVWNAVRAEPRGTIGPLAPYRAVSDVVKGLERLRSGDICAAADALRNVNARVYARAFDAVATQSAISVNGGLPLQASPTLQEGSHKVATAAADFHSFSEAGRGMAETGAGSFAAAAGPALKRTGSILGVCTPEDVAMYAMLCCLAVNTREELKEQLAEDAPLRKVLEPSPVALQAAVLFSLSDFEQAFKVICDMTPAFERDLLLGEECTAHLLREIRRNAVLEFTTAYSSLTLSTLLEAFPQHSAAALREDVVAVIESRTLPFRYDGVNDILWRNEPDGIEAVVEEARRTAADLTHTCQRLCLNVSVEEVFGTGLHSAYRDDSPVSKRSIVGDRGREGRRFRGNGAGGTFRQGTTVTQRRTRGRHGGA